MKTKLTKEEHVAIGHKLQTLCAELQIICVRVQSAESPLSSVAGNARKVGTILDSARPLDLLRCQLEDVFYRDFPSDGPSPYYNTAEKVKA